MIAKFVYYCNVVRWFIIGGRKPVNLIKTTQSKTNMKNYNNWSKAEYQMHFRNAASNLGMLHEARELWNKSQQSQRCRPVSGRASSQAQVVHQREMLGP